MHFWKRLFGHRLQGVKATPRHNHAQDVAPQFKPILMVMVSEEDCTGQSQVIRQLEQQGAELAITDLANPALRLNALKAFLLVEEANRKKDHSELFKRIMYVEKNARYRNKAAKRSPMVIAVENLEEAVKTLDPLIFFS